jgi:electron transport complex protein RnfB
VNPTDDVYRRLQAHLDHSFIPFPATESGVELRLLRRLFNEAQARIALELSALPETVATIRKRIPSLTAEELRAKLDEMESRGLILATGRGEGELRYAKLAFVVGIYERQLERITPEFERDVRAYFEEAFDAAAHTTKTRQMRTVPVGQSIPVERNVATYDDLREYVRRIEGPFAVMACICRKGAEMLGEKCKQTGIRENCLTFGGGATEMVRLSGARFISREQMLDLLDAADREALVLQPENTANPLFVCCCCGCCCAVLTAAKRFPKPAQYFSANYYAGVNAEACEFCGTCVHRCQMDAVRMDGGPARVDGERCIGCGLCVTTCPSGAMELRKHEFEHVPPKDTRALYLKLLRDRYGPLKTAEAMSGYVLGRKF